jgi:hypothetical protein
VKSNLPRSILAIAALASGAFAIDALLILMDPSNSHPGNEGGGGLVLIGLAVLFVIHTLAAVSAGPRLAREWAGYSFFENLKIYLIFLVIVWFVGIVVSIPILLVMFSGI